MRSLTTAPTLDDPRYATRRWGLCFVQPETERGYRAWFVEQAVPFEQIALAASTIGWLFVLVLPYVWLPPGAGREIVPWTVLLILPLLAIVSLSTVLPSWRRAMLPLCAVANAVAGLVLVGPLAAGVFEQPEASGLTVVLMLFAFAVFRLTLVQAVAAVSTYLALDLAIAVSHLRAGELTAAEGLLHLSMPIVLFVMSMAIHLLRTRVLRESFQKERIIALQHEVIEEERDRADRLLLNILPGPIAERLKDDPGVIADAHEDVTVLFADLVGFTNLSRTLPADQLVARLDEVFSRFDDLADRHGVEKIRTMGDGYLAVAGLPTPRPDHARAVVDLAGSMIEATAELAVRHALPWQVRVGVHTGPVVAGVIGHRKFTYDLWGNTVNVASRLESTGEPGRIHVSRATLAHLGDVPHVRRGPIELRHVGAVETVFLDRASTDARPPADDASPVTEG